ncbi:hypothetical protein HanRHA438_Chr15g0711061 [Helianthus annuus]|nr:hypothetical protein HanRHA438_Chr15g0711061 [Helianthus annuus]
MSSNSFQSKSTKSLTTQHRQSFKIIKIKSQKLQTLITNRHSLQPKLLQERIRSRENIQPRLHIRSPIVRHQIEIRKPRFTFQRHAPDCRKPSGYNLRRNGVAVPD